MIMFVQDRESIEQVEIPVNWGLWLEHIEIIDGVETLIPATCEITEEEIPE